ncbi:hypothetical protein GH714_008231 [Hevea brasiliensis]|uniref:Uncharacterized protein n=1 Tax=Hevea brasiliensis TaxID=3981 RepID=A0A6A6M1J9_HEVBR|nr:hypothetical protein GH714_008231 [Hevea brasiliensis]
MLCVRKGSGGWGGDEARSTTSDNPLFCEQESGVRFLNSMDGEEVVGSGLWGELLGAWDGDVGDDGIVMADDQTKVVNPKTVMADDQTKVLNPREKKSGRPGNLKEKKIDTGKHDSPPAGHYSRGDSHLSRQGRKLWN